MKKWLFSFSVIIILFGILVALGYLKKGNDPSYEFIFLDALSLSGFFAILFSCFVWVSQEGAFDILIYGTKRFFKSFTKRREDDPFPKTFLEYVEIKREKTKLPVLPTMIVALIPITIYIILRMLGIHC
ncbi:MAG: DUF3899 domain-containing protein [Bacilli bacterium]